MEGGSGNDKPRTMEDVIRDFRGRRAGVIKALTTDVDEFYKLCDPEAEESLSLWGLPDGTWEVRPPAEEPPPAIPEPAEGINFARDGNEYCRGWLTLIAYHSNSWLLAVAFFWAGCVFFDKEKRDCLFELINDLPTISEVVIKDGRMPTIDKHEKTPKSSIKSNKPRLKLKMIDRSHETLKSSTKSNKPSLKLKLIDKSHKTPKSSTKSSKLSLKPSPQSNRESPTIAPSEEDEGSRGEGEDGFCVACGNKSFDEFWICCDVCDTWYHGSCVGITPAVADEISKYECPSCSNKRQRR